MKTAGDEDLTARRRHKRSRSSGNRAGQIALISVPILGALYFAAGAALLHYGLDDMLWPRHSPSGLLPPPAYASLADGTGSIVRAIGPRTGRCVVFFPGQSGGFVRYVRDLFAPLNEAGFQVWAVSYPGQDGAKGKANRASVLSQIRRLLGAISPHCPKEQTVFVGRSLGASVAAISAASWRPSGLVLEGASASLDAAVRHRLARHWYTRLLQLLPINALVAPDFPLAVSVAQFGPTRTTLFQGQLDEVTPLKDVEGLKRMGVTVHVVPRATHTNAYLLAGPRFVTAVAQLGNAPEYAGQ